MFSKSMDGNNLLVKDNKVVNILKFWMIIQINILKIEKTFNNGYQLYKMIEKCQWLQIKTL
jgi:hypothetical protein